MSQEEKWVLCPLCGGKTRLRILQKTVLQNFPLFCPKCRRETVINARNFQIENPTSRTHRRSADHIPRGQHCFFRRYV